MATADSSVAAVLSPQCRTASFGQLARLIAILRREARETPLLEDKARIREAVTTLLVALDRLHEQRDTEAGELIAEAEAVWRGDGPAPAERCRDCGAPRAPGETCSDLECPSYHAEVS